MLIHIKASKLKFFTDISECRLIGQEQNGSFLLSWVQTKKDQSTSQTHIGIYSYRENTLNKIYSFREKTTCTQASINFEQTVLGFITKENNPHPPHTYRAFLYSVGKDYDDVLDLKVESTKQVMIQFLYSKQSVLTEIQNIKFLLFIHQEGNNTQYIDNFD